jgi:hypothetical protein
MTDLQILRTELEDANALVITLVGRNTVADSLTNARALCQRLREEGQDGLIMDYRRCSLDHTVAQFAEVGAVFAEQMPNTVRVAYIYAPENFMHAAVMTKQLAKAGLAARAFNGFEDAAAFVRASA